MAGRGWTWHGLTCGAKTRRGTPCQCKMLHKGMRCKYHGGWSTGPKTAEGRARCGEAGRRNLNAWHALRKG
jgi:hypothetical protein